MAEVQKRAVKADVFFNGVPVNYVVCTEVGRSCGGRSLDYGQMVVAPHPTMGPGFNVKDLGLLEDLSQKQCTIQIRDERGAKRVVHWGFVDAKSVAINQSEYQVITSRLQPYHFGQPIRGMYVWSPFAGKAIDALEPIVFNPQLDGQVVSNMSLRYDESIKTQLFMHPECQRTQSSRETNGAANTLPWSLASACHYLIWAGNTAETFIANPNITELALILGIDQDILRNHQQPFGEYLPANLDALLEPYGFSWKVDLSGAKPKIAVFRRGAGFPIYAKLAPAGDWVDLTTSNAEEVNVTTDVTNHLANSMEVYGDTVMAEMTVELVPGWLPAYDEIAATLLSKTELHGGASRAWDSDPNLARVWRDWVLNEAGDYIGLRSRPGYSGPFDFNSLAGLELCYQAKRRKLLPCVSIGADLRPVGEHHGIEVEYFAWDMDPTSATPRYLDTGSWQPIEHNTSSDGCTVQVLDKECGIRFCGTHIPMDLVKYGATGAHPARIRVTATIEMDARVGAAQTAGRSANIHLVKRVIDVGSRFKERVVLGASKFAGIAASTSVDDRAKANKLALELLNNWNQASINGTVSLIGCDHEMANDCVGKSFGGIQGRGIEFKTTEGTAKYPSITAMKLDFVNQKTVFSLDTWKRDNA